MSEQKLKTQIKLLTTGLILVTLIFGSILIWLYKRTQIQQTDELTIKKINLIGEDGSLRMVLSNEDRQHPGIIDGKQLPKRQRPAGMIFFDNNGNECGGLIFNESNENGKINKMMSFTMDNHRNDQVLQLINDETYQNGKASIRRGMAINEYPVGKTLMQYIEDLDSIQLIQDSAAQQQALTAIRKNDGPQRRLFIGRNNQNQSGIFLYDNAGRPRMQIFVDSSGTPQIISVDTSGKATKMVTLQKS